MGVEPEWLLEIADSRLSQVSETLVWLLGRHSFDHTTLPDALEHITKAHAIIQQVRFDGRG